MSTRPLRVVQVIPDLRVGGAERVALTLANGFAEAGHAAMLVAIKGGGPQQQRVRTDLGVRLEILGIDRRSIRQPLGLWQDLRALKQRLCALLRDFQPDVVQTHIPEDDLLAGRCVRASGCGVHVPLIHSLQFHLHRPQLDLRQRMRMRLHGRCLRRAGQVVAVSRAVAQAVEQQLRIPADRIEVLHNGVDLRPYQDLPPTAAARTRLGLPTDQPLALGLGRLHAAKNFPLLVRASARVLAEQPQVRFAIVGEGDQRGRIETEIRRHGVEHAWTMLGQRDDVPLCLAAADVFVQSSDWEGFPVAVVEAMAAARPLVATDVAGVGEVVRDEENGLLVPKGGESRLAAAILRLIEETDLAQRCGAAARELAWGHYNLSAYIRRAEALFRRVLTETHA